MRAAVCLWCVTRQVWARQKLLGLLGRGEASDFFATHRRHRSRGSWCGRGACRASASSARARRPGRCTRGRTSCRSWPCGPRSGSGCAWRWRRPAPIWSSRRSRCGARGIEGQGAAGPGVGGGGGGPAEPVAVRWWAVRRGGTHRSSDKMNTMFGLLGRAPAATAVAAARQAESAYIRMDSIWPARRARAAGGAACSRRAWRAAIYIPYIYRPRHS